MPGGVFSFPDLRVGLPGPKAYSGRLMLSSKISSNPCLTLLFGECGLNWCLAILLGLLGPSFMALSKTSGSSLAPGGSLFLLGLP